MGIKVTNIPETLPTSTIDLNSLTAKTTPVDADLTLLGDSASSFANKKSTFTNLKTFLKTYFDTLYQTVSTALLKANNLSDLTNVATAKSNLSLVKSDVGLGNVDNTTDLNKPVSTATQTALDLKVTEISGTDNAIVRNDGTGGNIQNSGVLVDDSNNIVLPTTTAGNSIGFVFKGAVRFIHNYFGNYSGLLGNNLFIGMDSGNVTSNGSSANYEASFNIGIGSNTLKAVTTGYYNTAIGYDSLKAVTTGRLNFGLGTLSLQAVTTGSRNVAVGGECSYYTGATSTDNTMVGSRAGYGVTGNSYSNNTGIGSSALYALTKGGNNVAIGYQAGNVLTTGAYNIIIGHDCDPSANNASNELNIGNVIKGTGMYGAGKVGIYNGSMGAFIGGKEKEFFADAGNTTTGETDAMSYTTPANRLNVNGECLEGEYCGTFVNHISDTRQIKLKFATITIFDSTALPTPTSTQWNLKFSIVRVSSSVVRCSVTFTNSTGILFLPTQYTEVTGLTLSNTNILKLTLQSSTNTNDIVAKSGIIKWLAAGN